MGIPEGEERENGAESIFKEIITENLPNLGKELDTHVHKANRTPYISMQKEVSFYLFSKMHTKTVNNKERILKAVREKIQ